MKHDTSIDAAAVRAVLALLPAQALADEIVRRLVALELPAAAPTPRSRSRRRRRTAAAPRARGRRRRAPAAAEAANAGAAASSVGANPPPSSAAPKERQVRPLKIGRESSLPGFKFDVGAIVEGRAPPPRGTISIDQAKALLLDMRKYVDAHPQPKIARNAPRDLCAFRLARFLSMETGAFERRLGLRSGRPSGPPIKLGSDSSGSSMAPPSKAQLMAGR